SNRTRLPPFIVRVFTNGCKTPATFSGLAQPGVPARTSKKLPYSISPANERSVEKKWGGCTQRAENGRSPSPLPLSPEGRGGQLGPPRPSGERGRGEGLRDFAGLRGGVPSPGVRPCGPASP